VGDGKGQRMSPVQAGGGKGSGSGAGASGGRPGPTNAKKTGGPTKGKRPAGSPQTKPGAKGVHKVDHRGGPKSGPKGKAGTTISARAPSRLSPSTMAFIAVGIVVVIVLVFVVVKVSGGGTSSNTAAPSETAAPASLVSTVTNASTDLMNQVGVPSSVQVPKVAKNQAVLMVNGKPLVLFIGGLFCPYCAAERWAIIIALSPFGTWSGLQETTSSPWDTDPATATFAFNGAGFTSSYITFQSAEAEGNDTTGPGTRQPLQQLTSQQSQLWSKYSQYFGLAGEGFPFLDVANQVFVVSPSYDPAVLAGLDQSEIASKLSNPNDPVTQAIFGTANYIRAAVCSVTGQQPASACNQSGVKAAAKSMGI